MTKWAFLTLAVASVLIYAGGAVDAATVTYNFAGVIDSADPSAPPAFQVGQTFSGTYSVDSTILPNTPNDGADLVYEALVSFTVNFGSYAATKTGSPGAEVQSDFKGGPGSNPNDIYAVVARGMTGGDIGGFTIADTFILRMDATLHNVYVPGYNGSPDSTAPLLTNISLADFDKSGVFFSLVPVTGGSAISESGHLTALSSVPEPASAAMWSLGGALAALAGWRRRQPVA